MKKLLKRGLALVLALTLAIPAALASDALGSRLIGRTVELAKGTELTVNRLWSAAYTDLRTEHYVTCEPSRTVSALLWHGETRTEKASLSAAAAALEAEGYRVIAGINGGFFNSDGTGVGLVLSDGVIRAMDIQNHYMVGILSDGTFFVDDSTVEKKLTWTDGSGAAVEFDVAGINASRANGGVFLFNGDFGTSMDNTLGGVDVVLRPKRSSTALTMDCTLTFTVEQVRDSTPTEVPVDNEIPEGCYVLSANRKYNAAGLEAMRSVPVGTEVTLTIGGADERWADARCGFSGIHLLVEEGEVGTGLGSGAAPRTAVGIKADGSAVFYTIDGRQKGYSIGASYTQVAQRLIELGCVTAVALDGGGSTTFGATLPGEEGFEVLSSPSGGGDRAVNNCLLLVTKVRPSGRKGGAYPESEYNVVMVGSDTAVSARTYDTNYYPLDTQREVEWSSDGGTFTTDEAGNTVFTAGDKPGWYELDASIFGKTTSMPVRVVNRLTTLSVVRRDVDIQVGTLLAERGEMIQLGAEATWYKLPVGLSDRCVEWSCDGAIGEITADGLFLAGAEDGTGTITAACGGVTTVIPVTVSRGDPFADIEGHWSQPYVTRLYKLGLTTGSVAEDGTCVYLPDQQLTRGQLLTFILRILDVDTGEYANVALPFEDADAIPAWVLPSVKAAYALSIFDGVERDGGLYADANGIIDREETMVMLGRILSEQRACDLTVFTDWRSVSAEAAPYVETLVAHGVINGSNGCLNPGQPLRRSEIAKMLVLVAELPHEEPAPRATEEENVTETPVTEELPGTADFYGS